MEFPFRNPRKGFWCGNPQDDTSGGGVIGQVTAEWEEFEQSCHLSSAENTSIERRKKLDHSMLGCNSAGHSLSANTFNHTSRVFEFREIGWSSNNVVKPENLLFLI